MAKRLLMSVNPFTICTRSKKYIAPGVVRYPGGIKYFPRHPDEKDPEFPPSKLFRVERHRRLKGATYCERNILQEIGLGYQGREVAILKNIPEINSRLWKIKHLIKIRPITFPHGEPTLADVDYTILEENGKCRVAKELKVAPEQLEARDAVEKDRTRLSMTSIEKDCRDKWVNPFSGGF